MNDAPSRAEALFLAAAEIAEPEERAALLVRECGGDRALRERVEGLLASHEGAGDFLEASAPSSEMEFSRVKLEEAGDRIGPYHLREQIGEGGFGTVWVAEQERPVRRRVALKIIKLGMDTKEVIARFEQERQALAMMDHPNIAKVFDAGATGTGRPYFVMELVRGVKITEYCDQTKLSTRGRLELFIAVCQAVQHAHQKGVIHRDLKPSNILVTLHDGVPVPKVIDFGVAKATRQQRLTDLTVYTQFEQMVGTPLYMSPEQAEISGVDIDTRSDIYSLGVLLYELLTGRTPFDPEELMRRGLDEIRRTIREQEPQTPSMFVRTMALDRRTDVARHRHADGAKLIGQIRGDLDWIVMKALEKDRSRRYDTANGLAADLKRHLNNEPVVARPASAAYRFQKAFRRNKVVFTAATAVAVALVAGIGMSTWQTVESRKAQRATEVARNGEQQQRLEAQSAQKVADAEARNASESQRQWRRLLYASDISLAQQTLKLNNLGRARRLLERHRPAPGEEDLRGWEWRYLWQLTRSNAFVTLTNRPMRGWSVGFSPDGNRLAVGWNDGRVDLWDVPGQRYIRALSDRKPRWARVAFSPVRNLLASTSEPKVVALYDLDSNQESILWRADDDAWQVRELSFSPDGSRLVIYAGAKPELGDAVWVVNVSSSQIESRHATVCSQNGFFGAARLSPDNRRLYLTRSDPVNSRCRIQCIDLTTGQELWQTEPQRDQGLSALAMSPDGMVLASGTAFEDPAIRVWDAATGRLLRQLDGHTSWVGKLVFTQDGRRLISAAADQSIRFWDTNNWTETHVLRGHVDEVHAVAISERAQLIASVSKDGDLMLWKDDGKTATDGYTRLPENLGRNEVVPLDQSRLLLLPSDKPPQLVDLKRDSAPVSVPEIGASTNVLGCFGTNILCHWDGTNQILVRELRGAEFIQRGAIALASAIRPTGFAYDVTHQLLAWSEATSSTSIYLARLATPGRRTELRSDVPALVPFRFSGDGNHLAAWTTGGDSLRVWNVESGHIVASINERLSDATFAAGGRVLVVAIKQGDDHEIRFYDLAHRESAPRGIAGRLLAPALAVSRDGGLVAASTFGGQVRLFDPARGEWIDDLHGHMNAALGIAFSADGGRLFSAYGAREAVKLWDVRTRQELLTLSGTGTTLRTARWSADGDVILAGAPWQAWRAPSWEEIAAEEAKEKTQPQRP